MGDEGGLHAGASGPDDVEELTAQNGLYTLVSRGSDGDSFEVLGSLSRAHVAADHEAWLGYFAAPDYDRIAARVLAASLSEPPRILRAFATAF